MQDNTRRVLKFHATSCLGFLKTKLQRNRQITGMISFVFAGKRTHTFAYVEADPESYTLNMKINSDTLTA